MEYPRGSSPHHTLRRYPIASYFNLLYLSSVSIASMGAKLRLISIIFIGSVHLNFQLIVSTYNIINYDTLWSIFDLIHLSNSTRSNTIVKYTSLCYFK